MAGITIKNLKELEQYVGRIIEEEIKKIGEETRKAVKMELWSKFYGRADYKPNQEETAYYERTFQLLDSIVCSPVKINSNEYAVSIYSDSSKIVPSYGNDGKWSQHQSVVDDSPFNEHLMEVVEYGNPSSIYGWEEFKIFGGIAERWEDDKVLLEHFKKVFRKKGFTVIEG